MTIKITTPAGLSTSKPGVYPAIKVQNLTGFPLSPTGTVAIIGEAVGGEPSVLDELEGAQIQAAKVRYKSGPIADALGILVNPSKDPRVPVGASKIIIVKVNQSTRSAKSLLNNAGSPVAAVTLLSKNWGADENNLSVRLTAGSVVDQDARIAGTIDGTFNFAGGETLIVVANGATYTFTNTLVGAAITTAAMVAEMNTAARWASSLKPVIASANALKISITLDPTVVTTGKLEMGYLSITASSTLDTIVGLVGTARGVRGSRFIIFKKGDVEESSIPELGSVGISVLYTGAGTAATLSIQNTLGQRLLTTSCTAAAGDDQSIVLGEDDAGTMVTKISLRELADRLNATGVYTAAVVFSNPDVSALELDYQSAIVIDTVAAPLHRDIDDLVDQVNTLSGLAVATRVSNVTGTLASVPTASLFTGATDGSATNSLWAAAFELLKQRRCNIVVPLISEDRGSVSIDTIDFLADSHAAWAWGEGRSPRNVYCSRLGTKTVIKAAAKALNSGFTSMVAGDPKTFSFGQSKVAYLDPWATSCLVAGLQAGSAVGEPTTFKIVNATGYRIRDNTWDPKADGGEMIDAGVTFLEPLDSGGYRVVVGNTTYGKDASFVYNRTSVVEVAGFLYYDLLQTLEGQFTGTKARTGSAVALANSIKARMEIYLKADIIVGDDLNEGIGYKDLRVQIGGGGFGGNTAVIDVTVTPVQGLDFQLPTIYLADIQQTAA